VLDAHPAAHRLVAQHPRQGGAFDRPGAEALVPRAGDRLLAEPFAGVADEVDAAGRE
jgi:hypothetical protein